MHAFVWIWRPQWVVGLMAAWALQYNLKRCAMWRYNKNVEKIPSEIWFFWIRWQLKWLRFFDHYDLSFSVGWLVGDAASWSGSWRSRWLTICIKKKSCAVETIWPWVLAAWRFVLLSVHSRIFHGFVASGDPQRRWSSGDAICLWPAIFF